MLILDLTFYLFVHSFCQFSDLTICLYWFWLLFRPAELLFVLEELEFVRQDQ